MCEAYGIPPVAGGALDQPIWVLQHRAVLAAGGYFDEQRPAVPGVLPADGRTPADPLASLPMTALPGPVSDSPVYDPPGILA
ncbi:MAG: hypothetical protein Q8Q14_03635 [Gemmatimonadales bacterium]|nr:hypothetical protein [Gemmatimonadales bacterium]